MNMKKLLSLIVATMCFSAIAQQTYVTNVTTTTSGLYPVFTNRVNLLSATVLSANNSVLEFFNAITNAPYNGTNYVIGSTNYTRGYAQSNIVTSFVQADTGITNWYTNAGLFTYTITNAPSTNRLAPAAVLVGGSQPITYNNINALCENGLTIRSTTNATIVLYYNFGR